MQGMTRGGLGAAAFSKQQLCRTDKSLCFLVNLFLDEFVIFVIKLDMNFDYLFRSSYMPV